MPKKEDTWCIETSYRHQKQAKNDRKVSSTQVQKKAPLETPEAISLHSGCHDNRKVQGL
jgi:hypothetical protein